MSLKLFHEAQAGEWAGYGAALSEMRRGRKSRHWIWYVFPQIDGLGRSSTARQYALRDLSETCAYLRDPVLRARYEEIAGVVDEQLAAGISPEALMNSSVDAQKLVSSLTLFRAAAERLQAEDPSFGALAQRCSSILDKADRGGYSPCSFTLARVAG